MDNNKENKGRDERGNICGWLYPSTKHKTNTTPNKDEVFEFAKMTPLNMEKIIRKVLQESKQNTIERIKKE